MKDWCNMDIIEKKINLFEVDEKYKFAHCISSDCALGAGIAVEFEKRFQLKRELQKYSEAEKQFPTCIFVNNVFNLITKQKYWNKPTYSSLKKSLEVMKTILVEDIENNRFIAMPKIGCGLDKLQWEKVRPIIEETFMELDVEILVCYL